MLLTTRIKGLIAKGTEVELELLGLKASVELLANVAQLDTDQVPPICLEIAQLCGKLQFREMKVITDRCCLLIRTLASLFEYRG